MQAGIALGSNLGESKNILMWSIERLKKLHRGSLEKFLLSSFYQTTPLDCPPGSPLFLNAVLQLETDLAAEELLLFLQKLEEESGRPSSHAYHAPRTLDLDLLYYGSMELVTEKLELPHPRIRQRLFVLKPLVEIHPHLILPGWSSSAYSYLLLLEKQYGYE